jgi:hypothetical protein
VGVRESRARARDALNEARAKLEDLIGEPGTVKVGGVAVPVGKITLGDMGAFFRLTGRAFEESVLDLEGITVLWYLSLLHVDRSLTQAETDEMLPVDLTMDGEWIPEFLRAAGLGRMLPEAGPKESEQPAAEEASTG